MVHKKFNHFLSVIFLCGSYALPLFLLSGNLLLANNYVAIIAVWLTAMFLVCGEMIAAFGIVLAGIAAESLSVLPTGTVMIASACAGLASLSLCKNQSMRFVWRGVIIAMTATFLWSGLIELIQFLQPGNELRAVDVVWVVFTQGVLAAALWLVLLTFYLGIAGLFKQPVRPL